jgi:nucleotidyltransferase substrate binding protein (TIGR01987 family)
MSKRKVDDSLANLRKAMDRLREALEVPRTDPLVVEGTIQRFEFVIEIFWKALKRALEYEGIVVKTPRESLKQAFAAGWLSDETAWLDMLDTRNTTSHLYLHEDLVEEAYDDIKKNFPELERTYQFLRDRYANSPSPEASSE